MPKAAKNILFIMFDQLRFDYLSCYGHPHLHTPHIDRLAAQGVRFTNCYVQSPICGSSRMSFYTGRYVDSHGAAWNNFPLKVGEYTLGDHVRKLGMDAYLIGKTHMKVDEDGMARLGLSADNVIGARVAECGFDVFERDDGLWAAGPDGYYDERVSPYNQYLKSKGYVGENPWHDYANSGVDDNGDIASGWVLLHADKPANIREEDSETPYMTRRCMDFVDQMQAVEKPWLCHLSYIKPHWPYIVPKPYHGMYGRQSVLPLNRGEFEREQAHPVMREFMENPVAKAFHREDVLDAVIPTYMGLIKQCDDQLGRLFSHLEKTGRMDDTVIVITSDHGDYLGDHWQAEKGMFHEPSVKVPLIIYDPSAGADASRGTVCDALVESLDLAATFVEVAGGRLEGELDHILEGRSLLPWLHGKQPEQWREVVISEYDYSMTPMAVKLGIAPRDARLYMVADQRWKYIHVIGDYPPLLFDRLHDPRELNDLGGSAEPEHMEVKRKMEQHLAEWGRRYAQRTTRSDQQINAMRGRSRRKGVLLGLADGSEVDEALKCKIVGKVADKYV